MKPFQKVLLAVAALGLLAAAGCEKPYDYTMQRNRIFVLGRLLVGQTCDVRVIWRQAPEDEAPVTVTADLSEIGGDAAQVLTATGNGIWRWSGQVEPDTCGEREITITVVDGQEQQKGICKRFPVYKTEKAVALGAGEYLRLAVKADGTVLTWKNSDNGTAIIPVEVPAELSDVVAVAAAPNLGNGKPDYCLALKADGTVVEWGDNDTDPIMPFIETPQGLSDVVAIARNSGHSLALKADGTVVAWGDNSFGESDVPAGLTDVIAISAGLGNSFALKADGTLVYWGNVFAGEVTHKKIIAVSAGCSGCNYVVNEYGNAYLDSSSYLDCYKIPVRAGGGFKAVAAAFRGLGLRKNGTVVSWTRAPAMGRMSYVNEGPENILAIAVGGYDDFRLALAEDGTVTDWFDDWYGHRENAVPAELK